MTHFVVVNFKRVDKRWPGDITRGQRLFGGKFMQTIRDCTPRLRFKSMVAL